MIEFDIGYYTDFKLPNNSTIPEQLQQTLQTVWDRKYDDLYERGGNSDVEEAFVEVMTNNFKGGTSPRIYPWNQSKIPNLKSSSPRIYTWGKSKI